MMMFLAQNLAFRVPLSNFGRRQSRLACSALAHTLSSPSGFKAKQTSALCLSSISRKRISPRWRPFHCNKILFNEETHVEDFIVRHPGTLRKLWLADCAIAVKDWDQGAPRQWSHIWKRFAWELKGLVLLIVRFGPLDENAFTTKSVGDYHSLGYIQPSSRPWQTYESCDQLLSYGHGDRMALNKLRRLVLWQAAEGQKCEG